MFDKDKDGQCGGNRKCRLNQYRNTVFQNHINNDVQCV